MLLKLKVFLWGFLTPRSWFTRHQTDEPLYCRTHSNDKTTTTSPNMGQSEKFKNTTQDLFELLERVQSCRLDDQRCVLPAYFTQVSLY
ncbi:hypothetical protein M8J77_019806 [Diaphorina citri]|nr:hypothetical protein M8J77_019806 [Diaphorina citri]